MKASKTPAAAPAAATAPAADPARANLLVYILVVFFFVSVSAHYWNAFYEGKRYPANTFLFDPYDPYGEELPVPRHDPPTLRHRWGDLLATWAQTRSGTPWVKTDVYPSNYLPFLHMVYLPFAQMPYPTAVWSFIFLFFAGLFAFHWRFTRRRDDPLNGLFNAFVLTFLTYPALMLVDRGNVEGFVFLPVALAAILFPTRPRAAAVLLGAAAAMKPFPAIFFLLFVADRRWRDIAAGVGAAVLLTLAGAACFDGGVVVSLQGVVAGLRHANDVLPGWWEALAHNASLLALLVPLFYFAGERVAPGSGMAGYRAAYDIFPWIGLLLLVGTILVFLVPRLHSRLAAWERWALLACVMLVAVPMSGGYRMIYLSIPVCLFLKAEVEKPRVRLWSVLFGLVLATKGFYVFFKRETTDGILHPILLLVMIGLVVHRALRGPAPAAPSPARA